MRVLNYPRKKCKYGMLVVTDETDLSEIFRCRYDCSEFSYEQRLEDVSAETFSDLAYKLQERAGKQSVVFCYCRKTDIAFYHNPYTNETHSVIFNKEGELTPIQLLENLLYTGLIPADDVIALHGAVVAKDAKAYLLAASTTCGKSTLTAYLWKKAGYEYITDDEIFIARSSSKVLPIRKNLSLRQGGYELLKDFVGRPEHIFDGKAHTYLLKPKEELAYTEYSVAGVVFLAGYGSTEPYFVKIEAREAFLRLLKGQLSNKNSEGNVADKYRLFAELSHKTYEMRYSDLWMAEKYLERLQQ